MEINKKNTDHFASGAYILNENRVPYSPFQNAASVFLTQENNTCLKEEILKLIEGSNKVLKICSFIITDKEIFDAILTKALNTNTSIFILTQLDQTKLTNSLSLLDFLTEEEIRENPFQTHLKFIKRLFDNGVHVRASVSAHAKFIIADRVFGFITSANLTTPSLNLNTESGVYLNDKSSSELDRLFDVIFQKGTSYRQFISTSKKNKMFVVKSEIKIQKEFLPDPSVSNLRYTYESITNNLFDEIIKIINNSLTYLYISTYSIVGLEKITEFTNAIYAASNRGVIINIFCRGMNYRNDHLKGSETMHSNGSKLFADLFNHSKGVINEKIGMIFTANIDGNHGLKNGFEVGYILDEKQRIEFLEIHKHLIETGYYIYQSKPTRIELFLTYNNYETVKNIKSPMFPKDIIISVKNDLKINEMELSELPLFYGKSTNGEYIIAGNSYYKCETKDDTFLIIEKENPRFDLVRYMLKYLNLKIISN